jgi:hypothetical protein
MKQKLLFICPSLMPFFGLAEDFNVQPGSSSNGCGFFSDWTATATNYAK